MRDDLLHYYERELAFLRRTGAEFGRKYPKVASRLELEPTKCEDPHVERLLEGFALLAARVHLKIDDDFPEISEALLGVVFPQYVRPVPSLSLVQLHVDPDQGGLTTGFTLPRGSPLYSRPVQGVPCRFRTCYDTTLWPVQVRDAEWTAPHQLSPPVRDRDAVAALRVELGCLPDVSFGKLGLDRLRFHLSADSGLASTLYELLLNNRLRVLVRDPEQRSGKVVELPDDALRPVGFDDDETLLPPPRRSLGLYGLLQEYFVFPDKFFFVELSGLERLRKAGFRKRAELVFLISSFERAERRDALANGVNRDTFRLGCTPAVNLFDKASEPVHVTQRRHDYPIVADARRRDTTGIFSVNRVSAVAPGHDEPIAFKPFFALDHGRSENGEEAVFWQVKRRAKGWRPDHGTDVHISFVDRAGELVRPDRDAVTAHLTCFNEDLPTRLPFGNEAEGDFEVPGGGPVSRVVALVKPTPPVQPPLGKPQLWRLISQLSLNYVSLVDAGGEGLRELLRLHNFADSLSAEKQIHGIKRLSAEPCYSRIESDHGLAFARGHRVEVEFDEEEFAGGGAYLFASVLERFLGRFVSLNSFSVLAARTLQRKELMKEWNPRAGSKALL